jgi:hypothetical protein
MDGVGVDVWSAELLRDDLRTSTGAEISYMKKKMVLRVLFADSGLPGFESVVRGILKG